MQKLKIFWSIATFILLTNLILPVYADDISEEVDVTVEELEEILEATAEITEVPSINSRKAVIYDRVTRKCTLWKRRE